MKKFLSLLLSFLITMVVLGQAPTQINYQGVARNSVGNVLPYQAIAVRLT